MTWPLGSMAKSQAPDTLFVSGSFAIANSAISAVRPGSVAHFTVARANAGVYVVTVDFPSQSVIDSDADVGPGAVVTGSLPTAKPVAQPIISKDYLTCDANGVNFAADSTKTKLLILQPNTAGNALADVTANYRLSFYALLSLAPYSK